MESVEVGDDLKPKRIRGRIIWPMAIVFITLTASLSFVFYSGIQQTITNEFQSKAVALVRILVASLENQVDVDPVVTQGFLDEIRKIRGVSFVFVEDAKGEVVAHTFSPTFPHDPEFSKAREELKGKGFANTSIIFSGDETLMVVAPVLSGQNGYVGIGMNVSAVLRETVKPVLQVGLIVAVFLTLFAILLLYREIDKIVSHLRSTNLQLRWAMKEADSAREGLIQASKMTALGEMAGGIAHEINSPLTVVQLCCDEIEADLKRDPEKIRIYLEKVRKVIARIAMTVNGLKLFARQGEQMPPADTTVSQLLDDTLLLCENRLKKDGIELIRKGDVNLQVRCRTVQLSQVLLNLISNSVDALAGREDKKIQVEWSKKGDYVEILVTDSGPGIPEQIRNKIFQPFFTTKEIGKGTGLGLSISKGLIESQGGAFLLDPNSDAATFIIRLPVPVAKYERLSA